MTDMLTQTGLNYETQMEDGKEIFRDADGVWCMIVDMHWIPVSVGTWDINGVEVCALLDYKRQMEDPMLSLRDDYVICDECRVLLGPDDEAYVETATNLALCDAHSAQNDDNTVTRVTS